MLNPDQIQDAGDAVAALYSDMESQMLDHLVDVLLDVDKLDQKSITELNLLAQSMTADLQKIVESNKEYIADEVYETCETFLKASDKDDVKRLGKGDLIFPQQLAATVTGMQLVMDRNNIKMVEAAKTAFLNTSIEAVTKVNSGLFTTERALHQAVRKLEGEGIPIEYVTYQNPKTGKTTITNHVDVAVRRHIRTQIAQDSARMTMDRLKTLDVALVEVSSHEGARPTHQAWEGRVFSLKGEITIDGTRYPDFYSSTGYGQVDGLLGANCRHSFGPYRHGAPRAYEPDPKSATGLSNDEIYELTQKQRYLERKIRDDKRQLRGAQLEYEKHPDKLENKTNLLKAKETLARRQAQMRDFIEEANAKCKKGTSVLTRNPRREWAGDMPASVKVNASHRKLDDFLASKSEQLKSAGISKTKMKAAISGEMVKRGGTTADFASLSAKDQQTIFKSMIGSLRSPAKAANAKHVAKSAVDRTAPVYSKLETKHVDKIAQLVGKGTSATSRLYLRYENRFKLEDHAYRGTAHFDRERVGVYLHASKAYADQCGSMVTWFHEFGHNIDYVATGWEPFSVKKSNNMTMADCYASIRYKGGLFGATLKAEAVDYIKATQARIKADASARLDALDLRGMNAEGMLSDATYQALRHKARAYQRVTDPDFKAENWGMTAEEVEAAKGYKKEITAAVKRDPVYKEAIGIDRACEVVSKEIYAMTDAQKADLSDIFGGATGNKVDGGWGHRDGYWDNGNMALAKEAFAEFYSAHMSNPESLAVLRQYLPKSAQIFEDIIEAIEKGTI